MKFIKPYQLIEPEFQYEQEYLEIKYKKLDKETSELVIDKTINLQDNLNQNIDTNNIYSNIDKFQGINSKFGKIQESIEFMRKVGKNPDAVFNGQEQDLSWVPDNFNDLFKMGADLKEVYNDYINKVNSQESASIVQSMTEQKETKQETKQEKVGDN